MFVLHGLGGLAGRLWCPPRDADGGCSPDGAEGHHCQWRGLSPLWPGLWHQQQEAWAGTPQQRGGRALARWQGLCL